MKFAMCNEFCVNWAVEDVFKLARDTGYDGVEIAPFTLADSVLEVSGVRREAIRKAAEQTGVEIIGLHWLLVKPEGLYVTSPDAELRRRTRDYFAALIHFCADLGGDRLVIGSPKNRNLLPGVTYQMAWNWSVETFKSLMDTAEERQVKLCLEPLDVTECTFINSVAEGVQMCREIGHPNFRVHLDVKAMCGEGKGEPLADIIHGARGYAGHFHVNDANRNGPGWGNTDYAPIVKAVRDIGYDDYASVEVFDFRYKPEEIATRSLAFLKDAWAKY